LFQGKPGCETKNLKLSRELKYQYLKHNNGEIKKHLESIMQSVVRNKIYKYSYEIQQIYSHKVFDEM
jgi:hypothetical protein